MSRLYQSFLEFTVVIKFLLIEDVRESMQMIFNLFYYLFSNLYFLDFMQPYFYFVLTTERYIRVLSEMYCIVLNITDFTDM